MNTRKSRAVLSLVVALAAAAPAVRAETLPDPRRQELGPAARLQALLERVRLEQRRVATLEAEFTQFKESSMLVEPTEARGTFSYAAPDRVRWEYRSPNPISMLIRGDEMTVWYRDLDQVERVPVGRHSQRVLHYLGAGSSMDDLLEYFTVTLTMPQDGSSPYELALTPRFDRVARRVESLGLWIDPQLFLPVRLRFVEADGDVTDFRFANFTVNGELPGDRFELQLPANVEVRRLDLERHAGLR